MSENKVVLVFTKGGAGSGHFGHAGRQGKRGGSSPGGGAGGGGFAPTPLEISKLPRFSEISKKIGEGRAYIVHGALKNIKDNRMSPIKAWAESVDNENFYGSRLNIVTDRRAAMSIFQGYLKKYGIDQLTLTQIQEYERSQGVGE